MDVNALQRQLREFAAARDWQPYHAPKNLAMALMVEAAELLELFQWHTLTESRGFTRDPAHKERVADEVADVLLYLLQLADHTGVDVEQAVQHKLRKNAGKHPPRHPEKSPQPPAPGLRGHLLIDWENVQPKGEELRALVPEGTDLWLFHGPQQKVDVASYQRVYGEGNVTLVPRSGAGRNALDFQLSYYIGYVSARQPQGRFVVVSNDTGYDPMLSHARELGFHARRCEFRKPAPVSQPAVAEPAVPAKEKAALKTPAKPADSSAKATRQDVQRLAQLLQGMEPWERPGRCDALRVLLQTHLSEPSPQSPRVAHALSQLQAQKRVALKSDAVSYPSGTAIPAPGLPPATATKKKTAVPTAAQIAQAVLASLEKMPKNKPARREGLLKLIETHAVKAADPKAMAQQVCALLEARKEVTRSPDGKGVAYPKIQKK